MKHKYTNIGLKKKLPDEEGIYDCSKLLNFGIFKELKNKYYFNQVSVIVGTVAWPHDQDICPDTLYLDSKKKAS